MAAPKIPDEIKDFIVQALACYDTPSAVAEAVKEEFGLVVSRQAVEGYNPTKYAGRSLGEKWCAKFHAHREAFKKATNDIPIANRAYRLRALQRLAERAERMKNMALAAQLYEQAAKECGDSYTNRTKIEGKVATTARVVMVPSKDPG